MNKAAAKKFRDTRVNKKGHLYQHTEYTPSTEPPVKPAPLKKKKVKVQAAPTESAPTEQVPQPCPNCEKMQGIGPVSEWEKQQEQFIPFNMKNYQTRLLELLRRI